VAAQIAVHISSGAAAQHQRYAQEQGQHRTQPQRPGDHRGADQAGRRPPGGHGDQPGPDDPYPGIGDDALVTARQALDCLHAFDGIGWPGQAHQT
jgi:hypothetical protein